MTSFAHCSWSAVRRSRQASAVRGIGECTSGVSGVGEPGPLALLFCCFHDRREFIGKLEVHGCLDSASSDRDVEKRFLISLWVRSDVKRRGTNELSAPHSADLLLFCHAMPWLFDGDYWREGPDFDRRRALSGYRRA
jgi:hypothetical protein